MSTTFYNETVSVRRKGQVDTSSENGNDYRVEFATGDRRSRQIGKRHWVRKEFQAWCSGGGAWDFITIKSAGKEEKDIRKPTSN